MSTPVVHIGIVTFNSLADLPQCFAGIQAQTYPHIRVTVLDNASSDKSADWVTENALQTTLIRSSKNLGFGKGHNQIVETLNQGEFYLALNPDVQMHPTYIEAIVLALIAHPQAACASGKLIQPDGKTLYSVGHAMLQDGFVFNIGHQMPDDERFASSREMFIAPGAALIITSQFLATLPSLFEPVMFMYYEDTDLGWGARRQGWINLYVAEATAYHRGGKPNDALSVEAITNRYLSVFKNAYWPDLIFRNLPYILGHTVLRCVISPRLGFPMAGRLIRLFPVMIGKRRKPVLSRSQMHAWFKWSKTQPIQAFPNFGWRLQQFMKRFQRQ